MALQPEGQTEWLIEVHLSQNTTSRRSEIWYFSVKIRDADYDGLESEDLKSMSYETDRCTSERNFMLVEKRKYGENQ